LPDKEKLLISLYYYEELTMKEIGQIMGYTESRISQLHTQAMYRLKHKLRPYCPEV
jgi:RNA polymerase sigma factor for flagellar operon FliA